MFGCFDCAIAALDMVVVLLNRILGDLPRIQIVVVQIGHHLGRDPHQTPVIDSLFRVQHRHEHQRDAQSRAVLEVGIARAGIEKCLTALVPSRRRNRNRWG